MRSMLTAYLDAKYAPLEHILYIASRNREGNQRRRPNRPYSTLKHFFSIKIVDFAV